MPSKRLVLSLLMLGMAALLAACTTPTDGILAIQGFGHFGKTDVTLSGSSSGLTAQAIASTTSAPLVLANGSVSGLGNDEFQVRVTATGVPVASCRNNGQNRPPGQNPVSITGQGGGDLVPTTKKGKFVFQGVPSTISEQALIDLFTPFPCANDNWTAHLDFVFWDYVKLELIELATGNIVDFIEFSCTTVREPAPQISCSRL